MNSHNCRASLSGLLLALALAACDGGGGGGENPGDVTPPTVVATTPVDGASGAALTTGVAVTFSEAVTTAAGGVSTLSLNNGALPVSGTVSIAGRVVTFTPSAPLALNTRFTARVDVGLTDLSGNALAVPFIFNFTTEPAPWPGTRQLGTPAADTGNAVTTDSSGNIYIAGKTGGALAAPSAGGSDVFLARFATSGNPSFTTQIGTLVDDEAFAIAVDETGNSYLAGSTGGDLDGPGIGDPAFGDSDIFLAKFGPSGNLLFARQLGTLAADEARGVAVDGVGNIYVAGTTSQDLDGPGFGDPFLGGTDVFLAKFNPLGVILFSRQIGTQADDRAFAVAVDGVGNVHLTGSTTGDMDGPGSDSSAGGSDAFLAKFGASGNLLFTRQIGSLAADEARGVAVDGRGNVYVTGTTGQDLDGTGVGDPFLGGTDAFLAKFGSSGNLLFTRQFGTLVDDAAFAVAGDGAGDAYVTGTTSGGMAGQSAGGSDLFLAKFDALGNLLFTRQIGTLVDDAAFGVAAASLAGGGNVFMTGETSGDLDGNSSAGGFDLFLAKFDPFGTLQ